MPASSAAPAAATWGIGSLLRLPPGRKLAGLLFSLRSRHHRPHLLHSFPLILLFIVFCPLLAALLILIGAPARLTALLGRRADTRRDAASRFFVFDTGQRGFQFVTSLSDQCDVAASSSCSAPMASA